MMSRLHAWTVKSLIIRPQRIKVKVVKADRVFVRSAVVGVYVNGYGEGVVSTFAAAEDIRHMECPGQKQDRNQVYTQRA